MHSFVTSKNAQWRRLIWPTLYILGLCLDIRRRFLQERRQTGVGSLKSTNLPLSHCYIFFSFKNNVVINCTLRRHTVLDSCWQQYAWPWITWNARFNFTCALRMARLTYMYVCCGVRSCIVKALNGFLMTQRQMTVKDECGCRAYNVTKLHRPRILDAFLVDTVDTTRL